MRTSILETRIPTLFGLVLLIAGLIITSIFVKTGIIFNSGASAGQAPQNIHITNITDSSFTVSYLTTQQTTGAVSLKADTSSQTYFDDRYTQQPTTTSSLHYITIKGLQQQTSYSFTIVNGNQSFTNNGSSFTVTTGIPLTTAQPSSKVISGHIIDTDGSTPMEAIVYIKSESSQVVSTLVNNGIYTIPFNLRNQDLTSYISDSKVMQMEVLGQNKESNVTILASEVQNVPTIILSKNYDFTLSNTPIPINNNTPLKFPSIASNSAITNGPTIINLKNGQAFSDQKPSFNGVASPGANVQIIIHSTPTIQTQVQAGTSGSWTYRPSESLAPGDHTITITTQDSSGIIKSITEPFTVYAAGTQVTQSATPSATPTITLGASPTPPILPTATPTIIPIQITTAPLILSTPTPTVIQPIVYITPTSSPAITPGNSLVNTLGTTGIVTSIFGILLFLCARLLI